MTASSKNNHNLIGLAMILNMKYQKPILLLFASE